jgi:hypothetical protein
MLERNTNDYSASRVVVSQGRAQRPFGYPSP